MLKIVNKRHKITPSCICVTNNKNKDVFSFSNLGNFDAKKTWKYTNLNLDMTFLIVQSVSFRRLFNFICEVLCHEHEFFVANFALTYSLYCRYDIFLRILAETVKELTVKRTTSKMCSQFSIVAY